MIFRPLVVLVLALAFASSARADSTVVFSEIMYYPATNEVEREWVELHNLMAVDMDLSKWSLAGGINYTFAEGTILAGGGFLVVALSPSTLMAETGLTNVHGPFAGRLSNSGETLELRNNNQRVMDVLEYGVDEKWPVAPDGAGVSLAKRNPLAATAIPENWLASVEIGGTPGAPNFPMILPSTNTVTIVAIESDWRFEDSGIDLGISWRETNFNDSGWSSGNALFYRGNALLPAAKNTQLSAGRTTYYFRKTFPFNGDANSLQVQLRSLVDDGAVVYLNGTELTRINMPGGAINYSTLASAPIGNADFADPIVISANQLVFGTNLLAVEVHQAATFDGYPQAVLNSSPIAYWRLGESSNAASDFASAPVAPQSGLQNGIFSGVATTNLTQAGPRPGNVVNSQAVAGFESDNRAPHFSGNNDGGDDVLTINDSGVFNFTQTRAFSLEAWVKGPSAQEVGAAIIAKGTGGGGEQFCIDVPNGAYRFFVRNNSGSPAATAANSAVGPNDSWQHIVAIYDQAAGVMRLYVNGVSVASATPPSTLLNTTHEVSVGSRKLSASSYNLNFDGNIDEVAIYNRALTTNEILAHFDAAFASGSGSGVDTNDVVFGLDLSTLETISATTEVKVLFNELASATNSFWFELFDNGPSNVNLAGYAIMKKGAVDAEYIFPPHTLAQGAFLQLTTNTLGFSVAPGDQLFFYNASKTKVLDAVIVTASLRGRFPDGAAAWLFPNAATPGASNSFVLHSEIVINEIMYHHRAESVTNDSPEAWIELFNRGSNAVNLTGWKFDEGITYNFPSNQVIAAGGYLVVAKDAAYLNSLYPGINAIGQFSGNLSKGGERLLLKDANGNPANTVHYFDGGRWPENADAGGSSLELRDPHADNSKAEAWAASIEGTESSWQTYTYRGVAQTPIAGLPDLWKEFQFGLLDGAGEILLDDISVIENPDTAPIQFIQNGSFNGGSSSHWRFLGNHRRSRVEAETGNPGNSVLHLIASDQTEYQGNQIETTFGNSESVVDGRIYEISFRAKWLAGKSLLNTRLYFNRLQRTTQLAVPALNGTPGAQNSVWTTNIGPTYAELNHSPAVPAAGEAVKISVIANDPDAIAQMKLWFAVDGNSWSSIPMNSFASNRYEATLPGESPGTLVHFYVEGRDGSNAVSYFPAAGTNSRALYRVNDGQAVSSPHNFRVLMKQADANFMHNVTNVLSNELLGGTVIYNEQEIFYDIGVRLKGSFVGRNVSRVGFNVRFDPSQLFRGIHDKVAIDRSQHSGVGQGEIIAKHIASHAGNIPNMYDDLVQFIAPRAQDTSRGQLRMAGFDDIFLDSQYEDGSDGSMFEFEVIRYSSATSDGTPEGIKLPGGGGYVNLDIKDYGDDKEVYRWSFLQSNNRTKDDYSRMIAMAKAFSLTGTNLDAQSQQTMDVDEWLRVFAYESLLGVSDAYFTGGNRHNFRMYVRPEDQKVLAFPWDWDSSFSRSTTASLVGIDNFAKIVNLPNNLRAYSAHLYDMVSTTFNPAYMTRWTQHYSALAAQDFSGILNYIGQRSAYVLSQLPTNTPFAITNNNGVNFAVSTNQIILGGTSPIQAHTIQINGIAYPLYWSALTNWSLTIPLNPGTNPIVAQGYDASGNAIATASDSISIFNSSSGVLLPVIVNEWMADNAAPNGFVYPGDGTYQDWFELFNPNNAPVDLSGFFLTDNLSQPTKWRIPTNTVIVGKGFLLVWADSRTNLNGMGTNGDLHASFSLAKGGEAIGLYGTNGLTPQSTVTFGAQTENVSKGFFPNGDTNRAYFMTSFTPRAANILPLLQFGNVSVVGGFLHLEWAAIPNESYRLQFKTNLADVAWINLGSDVVATGGSIRFTNQIGADPQRFYRALHVE